MAAIKPLIAGNWKMNGSRSNISDFAAIASGYNKTDTGKADAMICPPFTLLAALANHPDAGALAVGAQDCHVAQTGAHTGDISPEMITDCSASAVIVGHSERRADHGESNELIAQKAQASWRAGLMAIICIGETEQQRQNGDTLSVVESQLTGSVPQGATAKNTVIAYEPVWAIGTGLTASVEDVAEVHGHIRQLLVSSFGDEGASMRILYGGSVKLGNAAQLMAVDNVNGALVGGASLKPVDFLGILAAI